MTKEYLETILTEYGVPFTDALADRLLKEFEPCEDMVSRGVFEQVMWERDVAIEQLEELGYELGEKIEPCENAISRQSAIFLASDLKQDLPDDEHLTDMVMAHNEGILEYQTQLSLLPSVKPQYTEDEIQKMQDLEQAEIQKAYEIGKGERQIGHCKDCKFFEYDSVAKVDGIPLIVAHEICSRWGDGCKTKEDGYCFLYDPQESDDMGDYPDTIHNQFDNMTGSMNL